VITKNTCGCSFMDDEESETGLTQIWWCGQHAHPLAVRED
jgi:hypothetical protein